MVGTKGYSSYRGRGPKWKILLAILLVLVIAVAASVIYLQQFLVYGADGSRQIRLPWQTEEKAPPPDGEGEAPENQPDVDVVVQEPEDQSPKETAAFSLPAQALTQALWQETEKPAGANAVAVRLKTSNGTVYFNAANAVSGAVETEMDTAAALAAVTAQEGLHTIASVACLQDFKAANADVEGRGLKNTGGYIFYDGNNSLWLDPAKPGTREYVCALAKEIAELGKEDYENPRRRRKPGRLIIKPDAPLPLLRLGGGDPGQQVFVGNCHPPQCGTDGRQRDIGLIGQENQLDGCLQNGPGQAGDNGGVIPSPFS